MTKLFKVSKGRRYIINTPSFEEGVYTSYPNVLVYGAGTTAVNQPYFYTTANPTADPDVMKLWISKDQQYYFLFYRDQNWYITDLGLNALYQTLVPQPLMPQTMVSDSGLGDIGAQPSAQIRVI